jgi:TetR/AcrR family transcriptional regulator
MENAAPQTDARKATGSRRRVPGARRLEILQTLAAMLEDPRAERVTTASLAARLEVSEAALYRHFASKAQMFEGLIEFIETTIFRLINDISERETSGREQVRRTLQMLVEFAQTNRGMTRVLIGDALVNENDRLQERMNQLFDRVESSLRQSLRVALSQQELPGDVDPAARAALGVACVVGLWHRYAKSGFRRNPGEHLEGQLQALTGA